MSPLPLSRPAPLLALALAIAPLLSQGAKPPISNPDLTKGEPVPEGATHNWNLGATGARGWMYSQNLETSPARQILIQSVASGSPAEGVLQNGDVILGVGNEPFQGDARQAFGRALTQAESEAGGGKLVVQRWRQGVTEAVTIPLPVLGNYSATAPYDCPKSKRILEAGCAALAHKMEDPKYQQTNPISRSLNGLALLASGNENYRPLIAREAQWAAGPTLSSTSTWNNGYVISFLAEYVMATGDRSVMPGLERLVLEAAKSQSAVGSWGHGYAKPDGRLGGYGMMNAPGVPLTIALELARRAGIKDPALNTAIDRSCKLLRFYIGKGAIPYGDHHPWIENHEDNGKCGMAAVLFTLLEEKDGAQFFSRMSLASHGPERDTGHTGNFWNMTWAMPGVALNGPQATGAWMQEFGAWYYDFARQADGTFRHQGPPQLTQDSTGGWDATGAYLLAYAMPLKQITLTGKGVKWPEPLDAATAKRVVADGRGWSNNDRNSAYDQLPVELLFDMLGSWSPVVRERAAMALARRKTGPEPLMELLKSPSLEKQLGACQALAQLRGAAAPAVPALCEQLKAKDLWLRIKAADALAAIGQPARVAVPQILTMMAVGATPDDPRGMEQRYLSFVLFEGGGLLSGSIDGIDRTLLAKAVRAGLLNQDGRARSCIASVYRKLGDQDATPLLPDIRQAIAVPSPSGEMFADGVRIEGLKLLANLRYQEGIPACVNYIRDQNPWASQIRTAEILTILETYGTHAKACVADLEAMAATMEKGEPDFPLNLSKQKANDIRASIARIQASTVTPELKKIGK